MNLMLIALSLVLIMGHHSNEAQITPPQETYYSLSQKQFKSGRDKLTPEQRSSLQYINSEFSRIHKEANQLIAQKQFEDAIETYRSMLQYEPDYVYAYVHMGDVRSIEGDFASALDFYKQGEAIMEDVPLAIGLTVEPLMRIGDVYAKQGNYSKAADAYRKILYRVKEYDWKGADGKSIKTRLFTSTERFAYAFPGNRQYRVGNVTNNPDTLARAALYLSRAGQHDEAFYVYGLALKQLRLLNDNFTRSLSQNTIIDDTDLRWTDALILPKTANARTFEAACYAIMSLTIGEGSWVDESGKLWKSDRMATLAVAQKSVMLSPDFAPGQFALGLAYKKNQATEPDAIVNAQKAFERAATLENRFVSVSVKEVLKQAKVP